MMEQYLQSGLAAMGLPADGIPALCRYGELLLETNKVMNLTAITEPRDVAALHFLDSAALLTLEDFHGKSVVDVGTGAGFPGLPPADPGAHHPADAAGLSGQARPVSGVGLPGTGPHGCILHPQPGGGICRRPPGIL